MVKLDIFSENERRAKEAETILESWDYNWDMFYATKRRERVKMRSMVKAGNRVLAEDLKRLAQEKMAKGQIKTKNQVANQRARAIAKLFGGDTINAGGGILAVIIPTKDKDCILLLSAGGWSIDNTIEGTIYEQEDIDGAYEETT